MTIPMAAILLFGIGMTEWLIIGAAIALLFGASKLPKLGKGLGEGIRNFKKGITGELEAESKASEAKNSEPSDKNDSANEKEV